MPLHNSFQTIPHLHFLQDPGNEEFARGTISLQLLPGTSERSGKEINGIQVPWKLCVKTYLVQADALGGFCTSCQEWTRTGDTEGDAEEYECPACGENAVIGAEIWMLTHVS